MATNTFVGEGRISHGEPEKPPTPGSGLMPDLTPLFHQFFDYVLQNEGGYANDPNDAGGETMYGISAATARRRGLTPGSVTLTDAMDIYHDDYWVFWDWVDDPRLRIKIADAGVLIPRPNVIRMVQESLSHLGVNPGPVDGKAGPKTKTAMETLVGRGDASYLMVQFKLHMEAYLRRRVLLRPENRKFLRGWVNRSRREPEEIQ